ncbi:hypothetical protein ACEQ8H_002362 [Pleosporales sp. CAS-2024a]
MRREVGRQERLLSFVPPNAVTDVLEQAGISWPIRNPLYLAGEYGGETASPADIGTCPRVSKLAGPSKSSSHSHSLYGAASMSSLGRGCDDEALPRRRTQPRPQSHLSELTHHGKSRDGLNTIWDDSFGTFGDRHDEISLESWSTQGSTSNSTGDRVGSECMFARAQPSRPRPLPWRQARPSLQRTAKPSRKAQDAREEEQNKQVVLTLGDDDGLGQMMQAISPSKQQGDLPHGTSNQLGGHHGGRALVQHVYYPPKMGSMSLPGPPSAASLARKSSYAYHKTGSHYGRDQGSLGGGGGGEKRAAKYANVSPSLFGQASVASNKEMGRPWQKRRPTEFVAANRVPTPDMFAPAMAQWDADVAMRKPLSLLSGYRQEEEGHGRHGASYTGSGCGRVRSRKEGMRSYKSPPRLESDPGALVGPRRRMTREGQDSLQTMGYGDGKGAAAEEDVVEIIDVDGIEAELLDAATTSMEAAAAAAKLSPFPRQHKAGMSSVDSTLRIERQTRNALDEYLGVQSDMDMAADVGHGHGLDESGVVEVNGRAGQGDEDGTESEVGGKRKRREGSEGSESPLSKREKGGNGSAEDMEVEVEMEMQG